MSSLYSSCSCHQLLLIYDVSILSFHILRQQAFTAISSTSTFISDTCFHSFSFIITQNYGYSILHGLDIVWFMGMWGFELHNTWGGVLDNLSSTMRSWLVSTIDSHTVVFVWLLTCLQGASTVLAKHKSTFVDYILLGPINSNTIYRTHSLPGFLCQAQGNTKLSSIFCDCMWCLVLSAYSNIGKPWMCSFWLTWPFSCYESYL